MSDINALVKTLDDVADSIEAGPALEESSQPELYRAFQRLRGCLETPIERVTDLVLSFSELSALRTAINMGIFDIDDVSLERGLSVHEIASQTGTDPVLVGRIMRALAVTGFFDVLPSGTYKATPYVRQFGPDEYPRVALMMVFDCFFPSFVKLPEYLAQHGHRSPDDAYAGPFQYAWNTTQHVFDWLGSRPEKEALFARYMELTLRRMKWYAWTELFPAADRWRRTYCCGEDDAVEPLRFVDIGGGTGSSIKLLTDRLPGLRAQFYLQDRDDVVKQMIPELQALNEDPGKAVRVQTMPHSFFDKQPVRGADVYFLSRILHDWPDRESKTILSHICDAMESHSTLLIYERALPDTPTKLIPSVVQVDMTMMAVQTSMERTEGEFRELLFSVGLELLRAWRQDGPGSQFSVLEVVRRS